jgi:poly-gamma-glutamate synthesis protein (capsule biosynthesis protein)
MYFVGIDAKIGELMHLYMIPTQIERFRINRASASDVKWLKETLDRECRRLGTRVELSRDNTFRLRWN